MSAPEAGAARAAAEPPGPALAVDVPGLLAQLARSFALLLPVYALGYLGLSFSWVVLGLGLLWWCRRSRGLKASRLGRALALLDDEERAVRLGVRACDLPAWVSARPGPTRPGGRAELPPPLTSARVPSSPASQPPGLDLPGTLPAQDTSCPGRSPPRNLPTGDLHTQESIHPVAGTQDTGHPDTLPTQHTVPPPQGLP